MRYGPTFAELLEAAKKRREMAKKLHQQGMTYRAIGTELGVTYQRAQQLVKDTTKATKQ